MPNEFALQTRIAKANNQFGFRLLPALAAQKSENPNVFISPLSISLALAMLYNGTLGGAREAIAGTFGWSDLSQDDLNAAIAALVQNQGHDDPQVELAIANSIWARLGIQLAPDYLERMQAAFAGYITNLDFSKPQAAEEINTWVSEQTRHKIPEIVDASSVSQSIVILINALYFKGLWQSPFDPKKTQPGQFTNLDGSQASLPFMTQTGSFEYFEDKDLQAVRLPYGNGHLCMDILLPRPDISLEAFRQMLNVRQWDRWLYAYDQAQGMLRLPRFKIEYGAELKHFLAQIGMAPAFAIGADFSGMGAGDLQISKIIHKTFIQVDEAGAEAAAATAVLTLRGAMHVKHFSMHVDRPFFLAIVDRRSGLIWFMGYAAHLLQA
ncbi:MAG: serpin family protein [Chloroflexota bacterium]